MLVFLLLIVRAEGPVVGAGDAVRGNDRRSGGENALQVGRLGHDEHSDGELFRSCISRSRWSKKTLDEARAHIRVCLSVHQFRKSFRFNGEHELQGYYKSLAVT